ncbi:MAG TPA: NUDIX hydrolase [Gammaproteobacteria bacterium]|nr:NUDIX hydrolase [Gammaproteobacteria bacterium]|tara:strand:+ start:957 stop:1769 length:813 start_codon:yes stop_codon:yes gene_type:complete
MSEGKDATTIPPMPKPAATILLMRPGSNDLEVFMVVRHHQIDFASGALVFPGGKADPQDFADELLPYLSGAHATVDMRAAQVSAIREAFEECGILLARGADDTAIISGERLAALQSFREPMNKGEITLLDFLQTERLVLACDQLTHFAHWITPPMMPKRFDTHFYLAIPPADHIAVHDGYESVDSVWIKPSDAVDEAIAGKRTIIFPTLRNLEKLATWNDPDAAVSAAEASQIVPVLPWTEKRDDGTYLCIPPEAGYAISEEKMPERAAR